MLNEKTGIKQLSYFNQKQLSAKVSGYDKDFSDNGLSLTIKKEAIQPQQPTRLPQGGPITH